MAHAHAFHGITTFKQTNEADLWKIVGPHYIGLCEYSIRIRLRLNPEEDDSKEIIRILKNVEEKFSNGDISDADVVAKVSEDLIRISNGLLKTEWKRVKRGEISFLFIKYGSVVLASCAILRYADVIHWP